jgi:hypothetical protein
VIKVILVFKAFAEIIRNIVGTGFMPVGCTIKIKTLNHYNGGTK